MGSVDIASIFNKKKKDVLKPADRSTKIQFGPSVQKLRETIARKLLTMSLEELEERNLQEISFMKYLDLFKLKCVMTELFPSGSCNDMGRKYVQIGVN